MLIGEGQPEHWMKIVNWESPENFLELQLGEQPTNLLYDWAWAIVRQIN